MKPDTQFFTKTALEFLKWSELNPVGNIPKDVAKEGAGENRVPFAHLANSVPVYLFFKKLLTKEKTQKKVLDLGCGTGRNISYIKDTLKDSNYIFYGTDYSAACINYAKKQYKTQGVIFQKHTGKKIPFGNNYFDFIVSSHVLEHIAKQDSPQFLKEISRVLKKSGTAILGTPNRKYCQDLFYPNPGDLIKYRLIIPHEHEYYHLELKETLSKNSGLFASYKIYQTLNYINRKLMIEAISKIKPKPGLYQAMKFSLYNQLRSSKKLSDIMAKVGTEYILRKLKISYQDLVKSTILIKDNKIEGDNFIITLIK